MKMNKYPETGELRHRITFQQPVKTPDGYGGFKRDWQDLITVWAKVEPLSGMEFFYAHQISTKITHRVTVRYLNNINESMRILYNNRILEIESIVDVDEEHKFLEIMCRESK